MSEFEFLRHVTIGQYLPADSPFHRLDPRAKLLMAMFLIVGLVIGNNLAGMMVALMVLSGGFAVARVPLRYAAQGLRPVWFFFILLAVIQVFTIPQNDVGTTLWRWHSLVVTLTDLRIATIALLRFVALIWGLTLFSCVTSLTELIHGIEHLLRPLQRIGLPAHEVSLIGVIALRFVPLLAIEAERLAKAQASRGADFGRGRVGPFRQMMRFLPLLVPLFVNALRRAEVLALAMQARGYMGGRGRTHLVRLQARPMDGVAVILTAVWSAALIGLNWLDVDVVLYKMIF